METRHFKNDIVLNTAAGREKMNKTRMRVIATSACAKFKRYQTPFRACAVKNAQYSCYLLPNRRNLHVVWEIGVDELDGDVRFYTGNEM